MKKFQKHGLLGLAILCVFSPLKAHTPNLTEVFQDALASDPIWLAASAQHLSDQERVPISLAALLPALSLTSSGPSMVRTVASGPTATIGSGTTRGYTINLSLSQTLFDWSHLAHLAAQRALNQASHATLNAATEDLIIRVSRAYFQILSDQDHLTYLQAAGKAYQEQVKQVRQQYQAGLKTITDVYTAQASFESTMADTIGAENTLATDKENLRAITGKQYATLATLRDDFPLVTPRPSNIEAWVEAAGQQNWSIRAAQYAAQAQKEMIRKQLGGYLPSFHIQAGWQNQLSTTSSPDLLGTTGSNRTQTSSISLNMTFPLFSGGATMATVRKAQHDYVVSVQHLEQALRTTLSQTRQHYLNIVSGISKIKADQSAIRSSKLSLKGMRAGYHVGTETLVNILSQQKNVLLAETQYTQDRFAYINSLLALKQATGTLGMEDIKNINHWLQPFVKRRSKI